jgi:hypothetical protein
MLMIAYRNGLLWIKEVPEDWVQRREEQMMVSVRFALLGVRERCLTSQALDYLG